jgi:hypothetical protein
MYVQLVLDSLLQLGLVLAARVGALAAAVAAAAAADLVLLGVGVVDFDAFLFH